MQSHHYMQKKKGLIIKVELNEWARHRRSGYEFRTQLEYENQQAEASELKAAEEFSKSDIASDASELLIAAKEASIEARECARDVGKFLSVANNVATNKDRSELLSVAESAEELVKSAEGAAQDAVDVAQKLEDENSKEAEQAKTFAREAIDAAITTSKVSVEINKLVEKYKRKK